MPSRTALLLLSAHEALEAQQQVSSAGRADTTTTRRPYWALPTYSSRLTTKQLHRRLSKRGIIGSGSQLESVTSEKARKFPARADRGLVCFELCGEEELKLMMRGRGLGWRVRTEMEGREMGMWLEREEERSATAGGEFSQFMSLPPELRNRIYEMHLAGMRNSAKAKTPPPLCRVSKQVRGETSGLFEKHRGGGR